MDPAPTTPFQIADRLTEEYADLSPIAATTNGVGGRDHLWDDFSPEGEAAKAEWRARAIGELTPYLGHPDPIQAHAAQAIVGSLETLERRFRIGHWKSDLNHIHSPFQQARDSFDVVPRDTPEAWEAIRTRLSTLDRLLAGYRASLEVGLAEGRTAAVRQVESVIEQVGEVAGEGSRLDPYPAQAAGLGVDPEPVAAAVVAAKRAAAELAEWLESSYLPAATPRDAVGEERYLEGAGYFLGMELDPAATYAWGWGEVGRIRTEMEATAAEIDPERSIEEVIELLDTDPERSAPDHQAFARFVEGIEEEAVAKLDGSEFDVPAEIGKVTVNLAPPGGSLGAWYHQPSEDFTRPGSIWYALGERERIPLWQEVSTAYHEGFPGHHLQSGLTVVGGEKLSRFHRAFVWYSGSGEGWALYAERLMDELGYFDDPVYRLGFLASQLFRSVRVVVDVGCHLEETIPDDAPLHGGERWSYQTAVEYLHRVAYLPRDHAQSEVKRYLGWPGQAISYKVGEREILAMRESARAREGAAFSRKEFHRRLLDLGAIRLDHLHQGMR